jgi:hypothetical protein
MVTSCSEAHAEVALVNGDKGLVMSDLLRRDTPVERNAGIVEGCRKRHFGDGGVLVQSPGSGINNVLFCL